MKRLALILLGAGLALAPIACGAGATGVVLTLDSSRQVPTDVDGLDLHIEGSGKAKDQHFDLKNPFPQTVAVVVDDQETQVTITVTATKGGTAVTSTTVTAGLTTGAMADDTVNL